VAKGDDEGDDVVARGVGVDPDASCHGAPP